MKKTLAMVTLAVALTGCASQSGSVDSEPQAGSNRPTDAAVEEPVEEPVEEAPQSTTVKFGETYTYEDGVSITAGMPAPFQPGEYSLVEGASNYLAFDLTIVNGSSVNVDPAMWFGTLQSGNVEAEKVYDSEQLGDEPTTTLLPGREAAFKVGYAVADPADLVFEVTPGMIDYEAAIFTS